MMKRPMLERKLGTYALGALCAMGCSGEDIQLGPWAPSRDASAEDAGDPQPGDAGAEPAFAEPPLQHCDAPVSRELPVDVRVEVADPACAAPCRLEALKLHVAADGSVWLLARSRDAAGERLWLTHHDAKGVRLGMATVAQTAGNRSVEGWIWELPRTMVVDDHGHAWVLYHGREPGDSTHLQRFDASVREVDAQLLKGSYTDMVTYPGVGVLLVSGYGPRVVSALDHEGKLVWSRSDAKRGSGVLAVDRAGQIVVASRHGYMPNAPGYRPLVLDWLDLPDNEPLGTITPWTTLDGSQRFDAFRMYFDREARFTLVAPKPVHMELSESVHATYPQTAVERYDPERGSRWRWLTKGGRQAVATVDAASGMTVVAAQGDNHAALAMIPADGSSCRRFEIHGVDAFDALAAGPSGEIWFAGVEYHEDGAHDTWFGRLAQQQAVF